MSFQKKKKMEQEKLCNVAYLIFVRRHWNGILTPGVKLNTVWYMLEISFYGIHNLIWIVQETNQLQSIPLRNSNYQKIQSTLMTKSFKDLGGWEIMPRKISLLLFIGLYFSITVIVFQVLQLVLIHMGEVE